MENIWVFQRSFGLELGGSGEVSLGLAVQGSGFRVRGLGFLGLGFTP